MKPIEITVKNATVKIYRREREKNGATYQQFDVADYSTGRRKFISFADEDEARRKARDIASNLGGKKGSVVTLDGPAASAYLRAVELLEPTGAQLEMVSSAFVEAHAKLKGRSLIEAVDFFVRHNPVDLPVRTVKEVFDEMLKAKREEGLSVRYLQDLTSRLGRFAADFKVSVGSVTGGQVREWLQLMNVANRSRNNYRLGVQTLFAFAKGRGYLAKNWDELEAVPTWKTREEVVEIFSPAELRVLFAAAHNNMIPFLAVGAFAGLRSAEIQRLDWSKVNLQSGYITVDASIAKTNSRRLVPITDNLKAWLAPHTHKRGPVMEISNLANAIQRLVEATRPNAESDPAVQWRHNALRHSFCSYRMAEVKNAAQVALEAGNSPRMIFKHYRELVTPEQAKEWFSILPTGI